MIDEMQEQKQWKIDVKLENEIACQGTQKTKHTDQSEANPGSRG